MKTYWVLGGFTIIIMLTGYAAWPLLHPYLGFIKTCLVAFKEFCRHNAILGYLIYGVLLALILFIGLPFAMAVMLLAGITYDFWEAAMLITVCRLAVAVTAFQLVRHLVDKPMRARPQPALIKKFERHPKVGLLLARLSPLPDTTVNFAMGTSSLDCIQYAVISLIGMIPLTMFCVWAGNRLGSVSHLMRVLN